MLYYKKKKTENKITFCHYKSFNKSQKRVVAKIKQTEQNVKRRKHIYFTQTTSMKGKLNMKRNPNTWVVEVMKYKDTDSFLKITIMKKNKPETRGNIIQNEYIKKEQ